MKRCQSCGRLIELLEDFAGLDQSSIYCSSCGDDRGNLKSFEEVLDNLTQRIAKTDGFDESASRNAALQILGRQPAWEPRFKREEKVKNNKRNIVLISIGVVLVLATSVITLFFSKFDIGWEKEYSKYLSYYDDPFSKKIVYKENGLEITELKCRGNQEINRLENGILQFTSSEAVKKSKLNSDIKIIDFSNYVMNLDSGKSVKIGNISDTVTKDNELSKKRIKDVLDGKIRELSWSVPNLTFTGLISSSEIEKLTITDILSKMRTGILQSSYNIQNNTVKQSIAETQTCIKNVIYEDELLKLCTFPTPDNEYNTPSNIYLYKGNKSIPVASFSIGRRYAFFVDKKDDIVIIRLQNKIKGSGQFQFALIDTNKMNIVELNSLYQSNKVKIIKGTGSIVYEEIFNTRKYQLINLINNKIETMLEDSYNYILEDAFMLDGKISLLLSKLSTTKNLEKSYYIYNSNTKEQKLIMSGNYLIHSVCNGYIVYTDYIEKDTDNRTLNDGQNNRLMISNINRPSSVIILSSDLPSSESILIHFDGKYLAWTKYAGSKDDQWKNVCYTKIQ